MRIVSIKNQIVTIFAGAALISCAASPSLDSETKQIQQNYKSILQIHSDHQGLANYTASEALNNGEIILSPQSDFTQFRLLLSTAPARATAETATPLLLGRLHKKTQPVLFTVRYNLTDTTGRTIKRGEVSKQSTVTTSIYPRLESTKDVPADTLKEIAEEILEKTAKHMQGADWSTTVISHKDYSHASVGAGQEAGLKLGDLFKSQQEPHGTLTIVDFEEFGQSNRALLRLVDGFLPAIGQTLLPAGRMEGRKSTRPAGIKTTKEIKLKGPQPLPESKYQKEELLKGPKPLPESRYGRQPQESADEMPDYILDLELE